MTDSSSTLPSAYLLVYNFGFISRETSFDKLANILIGSSNENLKKIGHQFFEQRAIKEPYNFNQHTIDQLLDEADEVKGNLKKFFNHKAGCELHWGELAVFIKNEFARASREIPKVISGSVELEGLTSATPSEVLVDLIYKLPLAIEGYKSEYLTVAKMKAFKHALAGSMGIETLADAMEKFNGGFFTRIQDKLSPKEQAILPYFQIVLAAVKIRYPDIGRGAAIGTPD